MQFPGWSFAETPGHFSATITCMYSYGACLNLVDEGSYDTLTYRHLHTFDRRYRGSCGHRTGSWRACWISGGRALRIFLPETVST